MRTQSKQQDLLGWLSRLVSRAESNSMTHIKAMTSGIGLLAQEEGRIESCFTHTAAQYLQLALISTERVARLLNAQLRV